MFEVKDRVEVIVETDPLYKSTGTVQETCYDSSYRQVGVILDEGAPIGEGTVLWFGTEELRKVEA